MKNHTPTPERHQTLPQPLGVRGEAVFERGCEQQCQLHHASRSGSAGGCREERGGYRDWHEGGSVRGAHGGQRRQNTSSPRASFSLGLALDIHADTKHKALCAGWIVTYYCKVQASIIVTYTALLTGVGFTQPI